jgi:hypothetical protein
MQVVVATVTSQPSSAGLMLSMPFYQADGVTLKGLVAVDLEHTFFIPILSGVARGDVLVYIAETSTGYLVSTSSGEVPVSNSKLVKAIDAQNEVVSQSASYLTGATFGNTWAPDGSYFTSLNGESYLIDIKSYSDLQTKTLMWKVISVGAEKSVPTANYQTPQSDALTNTVTDITNTFNSVKSASKFTAWLSTGSLEDIPNTNHPIALNIEPSFDSLSREYMWLAYNMYKDMMPAQVVSILSLVIFCPSTLIFLPAICLCVNNP